MAKINDARQQALDNNNFRKVIATGENTQVVLMSIKPGEDIGEEVHPDNDQLLVIIEGEGTVVLDGEEDLFEAGDAVLVPAGTRHNFITKGDSPMKIITTYSPPHHPDGTVHATKAEAEEAEAAEEH
jgi:mannose-6-phosphate isomerase-like protein (cupin superfamily)